MKLIVGLGNPGEKYANVRHNLGFEVVDECVKKMDGGEWKLEKKFKSEILRFAQNDGEGLILAKPQTYMNNSGLAVKLIINYYQLPINNVIIVHDDLDILLGKIKIRVRGAAAGHHGVESIIQALRTDQFARIRLGIGNEQSHLGEHQRVTFNAEKFVLEPFMPGERAKVRHVIKQAVETLKTIVYNN